MNLADGTIREEAFGVPYGFGQHIATNADGTRLWVKTMASGYAAPEGYGVFDVATGRLLALNTSVQPDPWLYNQPNLFVDDRSNVILTVTRNGLVALHGETLQEVGSADAPKYRLDASQIPPYYRGGFWWDVMWHPDAAAIHTFEASWIETGDPSAIVTCKQSALTALDPRTGDRLATKNLADLTGAPMCFIPAVMTVAPAAPQNLAASVSGRSVTLTLDRPAGTTHYELEVGSAPGLRDLVVTSVPSFPITVEAAPPGTYYVRARALNYAGKGAYSHEIRLTVP